jgi:hypothetical protein
MDANPSFQIPEKTIEPAKFAKHAQKEGVVTIATISWGGG